MGMVINTNVSSLTAQRHLAESRADMEQAMERLSSGQRINSAMDDAAGLTIAHSLDSKITSLNQAVRNANDGIALVQLAEGAMDEVSAMLTRMKELATQAKNGTYSSSDLVNLNKEFQALSAEITRVSENTLFNGVSVLNGTDTINFQVGDSSSDVISATLKNMGSAYIGNRSGTTNLSASAFGSGVVITNEIESTEQVRVRVGDRTFTQNFVTGHNETLAALKQQIDDSGLASAVAVVNDAYTNSTFDGTATKITITSTATVSDIEIYSRTSTANISSQDISSSNNASNALVNVDYAIADIDSYRATLGAIANRMEHASSNLMSRVEHQSAARSRIQDADYAVESANLAKAQVLQQAGTAMLAQANASTQNILSLLK